MLIEELGQKIKNIYLSWRRGLNSSTGETDLRPIKKWLLLSLLIFLETLFILQLTINLAAVGRSIWTESQAVNLLQNKAKNIQSGYQTLEARPTVVENLLGTLSGSGLNSPLLEKITLWAGLNQVTLIGINFLPPEESPQPGLLKRRVDLIVWGEYPNLTAFAATINRQEPTAVLFELQLSLGGTKIGANQIEAKISLTSYYAGTTDKAGE